MDYRSRLHNIIPGGAHTYSRGDDQFPSNAPAILARGKGAYVYDPDGKEYVDYGLGLRSVSLGYAYEPVAKAAYEQILNGNNLTRASVIELEAAETLAALTGTDMVKFAKNGSSVTTAAVKLARAYTGRKYIAVCNQPFFSFDDWFIGVTLMNKGIPGEISSISLRFEYNNIDSLNQLFEQYPGQIAGVILEPAKSAMSPCEGTCTHEIYGEKSCSDLNCKNKNFLHKVRESCDKYGALFIMDEMITGFRWRLEGAQKYYNVKPDIITYGKAMANGFSVAAIAGKREIMQLGGIREEGAERLFFLSATHGAEMAGMGAFLATVKAYKELNVVSHLWSYGKQMMEGINAISKSLGIQGHFYFEGFHCSPNYAAKDKNKKDSFEFRTLFSQEMVKGGVLLPWVAYSYSHGNTELEKTLKAAENALEVYAQALDKGVEHYLAGKAVKPVFRKNN